MPLSVEVGDVKRLTTGEDASPLPIEDAVGDANWLMAEDASPLLIEDAVGDAIRFTIGDANCLTELGKEIGMDGFLHRARISSQQLLPTLPRQLLAKLKKLGLYRGPIGDLWGKL